MKSEYLRTLVESIATGSFSKAAENLFITQSAVSRRIKFLEDQYGHTLVDRSGPVLTATEAGLMVIEKAGKILQIETNLLNDLCGLSPVTGITFCCTPSFGITYLPEVMKGFMILKPDMLELKFFFVMPEKVIDGLRSGLYQVGVIEHTEDYDFAEFETYDLPGDDVVFASSPLLGLTEKELSIDTLVSFDLYTRKKGCCSSKLIEYNMKRLGRDQTDFNRIIYYDDLHLIISSALEGYGLAFLSKAVVEKLVGEGALRIHRATGFEHAYKRTLIVRKDSATTRVLDNFIEEIKKVFKTIPPQRAVPTGDDAVFSMPFAL